jgi:hypothetical protein
MEKPMNKSTLPQTDSIAELAAYWDSHDLTDHEAELEEVANPLTSQNVIEVSLNESQMASAQQIADSRGITLPALIQQWVGEHVAQSS